MCGIQIHSLMECFTDYILDKQILINVAQDIMQTRYTLALHSRGPNFEASGCSITEIRFEIPYNSISAIRQKEDEHGRKVACTLDYTTLINLE